jgi:hypothetical protein|tara:strand:- start:80 stop:235 length:156 start_codon:yes stop_codon:yes gene_type:complete
MVEQEVQVHQIQLQDQMFHTLAVVEDQHKFPEQEVLVELVVEAQEETVVVV